VPKISFPTKNISTTIDLDVEKLGQVFTPEIIVDLMISLKMNSKRTLEPSCGNGAFFNKINSSIVGIEIDSSKAPIDAIPIDFFNYPIEEKFDSIIGNPPYVRYQDIEPSTKLYLDSHLFDKRSNLYLFFIEKCIKHLSDNGELIFIVPREIIKSTSSQKLNNYIFQNGTITHFIDLGDSRIFDNAVPNCVIFRYEKGNFNRNVLYSNLFLNKEIKKISELNLKWNSTEFKVINGQMIFDKLRYEISLKDILEVKVGAVSGLDKIYADPKIGNLDFVFSETIKTGKTRKMFWPTSKTVGETVLKEFKNILISRKIRKFSENDWWQWGRSFPQNNLKRIYVNTKTRRSNPFFTHTCNNFDGSVLALFPYNQNLNLEDLCSMLNDLDWNNLGFYCDGRYIFSQNSLENCPVPNTFIKFK
jgi:adenine-specific DNA-methyltransferase